MTARLILFSLILSGLLACSRENVPLFDGVEFRGAAKSDARTDPRVFVATARPVSASFEGAVQAAAYEGTKHCLKFYGTSDIVWEVGPDTPRDSLAIRDDTVSFRGACVDK